MCALQKHSNSWFVYVCMFMNEVNKNVSQSERLDGDRKRMMSTRLHYDLRWCLKQQRVSSLVAIRVGVDRSGAGKCALDQDVQRYGWRLARRLSGGARRIHSDARWRRRDMGRWRRHRCSCIAGGFAIL